MHRGMADLVYDIRIPRSAGVLRGPVWHQIRQELVPAETRLAQGCISGATGTSAITHEPFAGMNRSDKSRYLKYFHIFYISYNPSKLSRDMASLVGKRRISQCTYHTKKSWKKLYTSLFQI